jgi:hypothetical protein
VDQIVSKSKPKNYNTRRDDYEDEYELRPIRKDRSEKKLKNLFRSRNVHKIVDAYKDEEYE